MSRFLFTTLFSNDLGLPSRTVPVALELVKRGHEVAFCNPEKAPKLSIWILIGYSGFIGALSLS